jgi:hypothetical protein
MSTHRLVALAFVLALSGCGTSTVATPSPLLTATGTPVAPTVSSVPSVEPSPAPTPADPCDVGAFRELPVSATCWVDPDADEATPLRVTYTVPAEGWSAFLGAYKDVGEDGELQRVNVLAAQITNVTVDACTEQRATDPPVGPTVDDLAAALAALPPFEVASPPSDVTAYGYSGKHLTIAVPPDLEWEVIAGTALFTGCYQGVLRTWIAPPLSFAFYGYAAPGDTEEFWILDVDGTRLVIAALRSANASADMVAEQQAMLDSIVIEP